MDEKIQEECWGGQVPVAFNLAPDEVTTMETPFPLFVLLPRMGYLPMLGHRVREHFSSAAPARQDELWFECDGIPINWTVPIGVWYDLLGGNCNVPLPITVHFLSFPERVLRRCRNEFTVQSHYLNTFKESWFLQYGNCSAVMDLAASKQRDLWHSVSQQNYSLFHSIFQDLRRTTATPSCCPVRIFFSGVQELMARRKDSANCSRSPDSDMKQTSGSKTVTNKKQHFFFVQRNVAIDGKKGSGTLGSLLASVVPELLVPSTPHSSEQPSSEQPPTPHSEQPFHALVQGVCPPLDTPLLWLCTHMCHPDQFLYISIVYTSLVKQRVHLLTTGLAAERQGWSY